MNQISDVMVDGKCNASGAKLAAEIVGAPLKKENHQKTKPSLRDESSGKCSYGAMIFSPEIKKGKPPNTIVSGYVEAKHSA